MNRNDQIYIERYAYWFCVPVKPATLFYGSINFITYALYSILVISNFGLNDSNSELYDYRHQYYTRSTTSISVTLNLFHTTVSIMLIYGVMKSKASYLMPFFGVQLFEFFFSLPMFLQSLYTTSHYQWDNDNRVDDNTWQTFRNPQTQTSPSLLLNIYNYKLMSPFFRLTYLCFQGFFLCIIWKCYRYLKLRELMIPINFATNVESALGQTLVSSSVSMPPPDYESVTKSSPPPDYESAIRSIIQTDPKQEETVVLSSDNINAKVEDNFNENMPSTNVNLVGNGAEQQAIIEQTTTSNTQTEIPIDQQQQQQKQITENGKLN